MPLRLLLSALLCLLPLAAAANDSSARLEAGGLRLIEEKDIVMEREDLYISRKQVHVEYLFRNTAAADKTIVVAFPLPLVKTAELYDSSVGVQSQNPVNFVDFKVWADGKQIMPKQDVRAWLNGKDITALLLRHRIPPSVFDPKFYDSMRNLPPASLQALKAAGAIGPDSTAQEAYPRWSYQVGYYWSQTFPAGRPVKFVHTYKPVVGTSVGMVDYMLSEPKEMSRVAQDYCMDLPFQNRLRAMQAAKPGQGVIMSHELGYILTTAKNWRGPIGSFRLIIDAGENEIMSTCVPGLEQTGPRRWSVQQQNYRPERDITIFYASSPAS